MRIKSKQEKEISKGSKLAHPSVISTKLSENRTKNSYIVRGEVSADNARRAVSISWNRAEELKAMKAYKKNVTKSKESANAFLKRIGAFDIQ